MKDEFTETLLYCLNDYLSHIEIIAKEFKRLEGKRGYITCSNYDITVLRHILRDTLRLDTTTEDMRKKILAVLLTVENMFEH